MDWHEILNTNRKKKFQLAHKKLVLTREYYVNEYGVNMAPRHVHTGKKAHA